MWPTFFRPSSGAATPGITEVGAVCSSDYTAPYSVTMDCSGLGLADGDVLLLVLHGAAPLGATVPLTITGFDGGQSILNGSIDNSPFVRLLPFDAAGSTIPSGLESNVGVAWKRWQAGDATSISLSGHAVSGCVHVLRGVHATDPFPAVNTYAGRPTGGNVSGAPCLPPMALPYIAHCVRFDLWKYGTGTSMPLSSLETPASEDVISTGYLQSTAPDGINVDPSVSVFYALRRPSDGEANNLVSYSDFNNAPVSSGWTLTNLTFSLETIAGITARRFTLVRDGASKLYEMRKSFTCEAGKVYCFWVHVDDNWRAMSIGYYRSSTFHGFRTSGLDTRIREGSDDVRIVREWIAQDSTDTGTMHHLAVYFSFGSETAIELMIGANSSTNPYSRTWTASSTSHWFQINGVGLAEVPSFQHTPALIRNTTGSPLTGVAMTHGCTPNTLPGHFTEDPDAGGANGSMPQAGLSLLIRAAGSAPPHVDIRDYETLPHSFDHESSTGFAQYKLATNGAWTNARRSGPVSAGFTCPRPIIPGIGHDKLYIEFYVASIGSESSSTSIHDPWFYVTIFADARSGYDHDNGEFPRDGFTTGRVNQWGYSRRGRWSEDGTVTVSEDVSAQITGSTYVGIGVNLTDRQITWYKNGTLVRTTSITAEQAKRWLSVGVGFGSGTRTSHFPKVSVNMTNPVHLPAGFQPIDWPNAVT